MGMSSRLSRAEQNDRNRALLLAAARRVFLARGYYAATLEQIADMALMVSPTTFPAEAA